MAVSYIAPTAQGGGDGTSADNAWAFSSLASAESQAGAGGTIYFVDGAYAFSGNKTFAGANNLTYESLNLHGAVLGDTGISRRLTIGSGAIDGIKVNKFKFTDVNQFYQYGVGTTDNSMDQVLHTSSVYVNLSGAEWFYGSSGTLNVTNSVFQPKIDANGYRFFSAGSKFTFTGCVIDIKTTNTPTNIGWMGATFVGTPFKKVIFQCDLDTAIANSSAGDFAQFSSNCCFFQFGVQNETGGTDNLYQTNPLFLDPTSGKFQLRPNSPCIGGGATTNQSRLETTHPTGKWFDSNAAGGGDGSYATPYDVIEDAIDSFTSCL